MVRIGEVWVQQLKEAGYPIYNHSIDERGICCMLQCHNRSRLENETDKGVLMLVKILIHVVKTRVILQLHQYIDFAEHFLVLYIICHYPHEDTLNEVLKYT